MRNKSLIIIAFTIFVDLLGFSIAIPILSALIGLKDYSSILPNTSYDQRLIILGYLIASYAIAQFFATPIIGQLSDIYGRKKLLLISLFGSFISRALFILGILNKDITLLFISRIIDGITGGNISVAQSAVSDVSKKYNIAKNFAFISIASGLGHIIGPFIGGRLADPSIVNFFSKFLPKFIASSSTLPLWFAVLLSFFNLVLVIWIFPETKISLVKAKFKISNSIVSMFRLFTDIKVRGIFFSIFFL